MADTHAQTDKEGRIVLRDLKPGDYDLAIDGRRAFAKIAALPGVVKASSYTIDVGVDRNAPGLASKTRMHKPYVITKDMSEAPPLFHIHVNPTKVGAPEVYFITISMESNPGGTAVTSGGKGGPAEAAANTSRSYITRPGVAMEAGKIEEKKPEQDDSASSH